MPKYRTIPGVKSVACSLMNPPNTDRYFCSMTTLKGGDEVKNISKIRLKAFDEIEGPFADRIFVAETMRGQWAKCEETDFGNHSELECKGWFSREASLL